MIVVDLELYGIPPFVDFLKVLQDGKMHRPIPPITIRNAQVGNVVTVLAKVDFFPERVEGLG